MSDIAIRVQGLSKQYQIWSKVERYKTLRESIVNAATDPIRRLRGGWNGSGGLETIWALKDVSFEVKRGEVVGIIGRNGAGKSTLLKLLSRITRPSAGRAEVYGRVGSLLEVGTGFHPELTGRENIYLNGAILGMRKAEIDRKFDEIVAFAETEKFLDTPVKHYSSGMFVRLAFAVAAHLEAEILMVDEVLAVGDAPFQEKCLGKMSDVARGGRAVLFVSHNTSAVASLCERCLLLDRGALQMAGGASAVIESYQSSIHALMAQTSDLSKADHYGSGKARFTSVKLAPQSPDGIDRPYLQPGNDLQVDLEIHSDAEIPGVNVCVIVFDSSGYRLIDANTALHSDFIDLKAGQRVRVRFCLKHLLLKPGLYIMGLWMGRGSFEHIDGVTYATSFDVAPNPEAVVHPEVFPGVYQCVFTHAIEIGDAGPSFR